MLGEIMRFELSKLGNRLVLKTFKNEWCTRAVFLKENEVDKILEGIQRNGWQIKVMEVE